MWWKKDMLVKDIEFIHKEQNFYRSYINISISLIIVIIYM